MNNILTREMITDICESISFIERKAKNGLCFNLYDNAYDVINRAIEKEHRVYNYNEDILIVENVELHMIEVFSKQPLKVINSSEEREGLFEEILLTRLCLENLDLTKVESMRNWFFGAYIDVIDFSNTKTPNLIDMSCMFACGKIKEIIWGGLNTSLVTNMSEMFSQCEIKELQLAPLVTSSVKDMCEMFFDCRALKIDCSGFDTRNVVNMDSMFLESRAQSLDLSSFNTLEVVNMDLMFSDCDAKVLNIKNFDMTNVKSYQNIFFNCEAKLIAKDKLIIREYEMETGNKVNKFIYKEIDDILKAKLENLDVDGSIIEKIMSSTSCELIVHLWVLTPHEICNELGLTKYQLTILLDEMEKVVDCIELRRERYINHINSCRKRLNKMGYSGLNC